MAKQENLALIGAGYWGKNLARVFKELGVLHTICDQSEMLLKQFSSEPFESVQKTTSLDSVLNDSKITKLAIAVPAANHYEIAKAGLLAGKDVFVEKPLCLDLSHARDLISIATDHRRILMVGHLLQYHPCIIKLKNLINEGTLGKLYYLASNRLNLGKFRTEENALWSFAPHDISVILSVLNQDFPEEVHCTGGSFLSNNIPDSTLTSLKFKSGAHAHIYVSWLNPFKEQKLTVVGSKGMAVFDDTLPWEKKLTLHKEYLNWDKGQIPTPMKSEGQQLLVEQSEPLKNECQHFLDCCETRESPRTNGEEGYQTLRLLHTAQESLESGQVRNNLETDAGPMSEANKADAFTAHPSAILDQGAEVGSGTKIWHFSHICKGAKIGKDCSIGQNVLVSDGVIIGNRCKIQNNVSLYTGVECEADVFLGPSCVFTNISNPRSEVSRKSLYEKTLVQRGATIGANATIISGITIGCFSFVAAGAVVTKDIPNYALVLGNPGRQVGWMSRHGHRIYPDEATCIACCPETGFKYRLTHDGNLECMDLDEYSDIEESLKTGKHSYRAYKKMPNTSAAH